MGKLNIRSHAYESHYIGRLCSNVARDCVICCTRITREEGNETVPLHYLDGRHLNLKFPIFD